MLDLPQNELLSAYIDGELTGDEQAEVERILASNPEAQQLVDELRSLSASLHSLPAYKLDVDLADRVLRQAEREMLAQPATPLPKFHQVDVPEPTAESWVRRILRPRNFAWSAVAVAVAVVLALTDQNSNDGTSQNIARVPGNAAIQPLDVTPTVEAVEQPTIPTIAAADEPEEYVKSTTDVPEAVTPGPQPSMVADAAPTPEPVEKAGEPGRGSDPLLVLQCELAEGRIGREALAKLLEQAGVSLDKPIPDGTEGTVELTLTTNQLRQVMNRLKSDKDQFTSYALQSTARTAAPRIPSAIGPGGSHPEALTATDGSEEKNFDKVTIPFQGKVTIEPKASANPAETTSVGAGSKSRATDTAEATAVKTPSSPPLKDDHTYRVRFVLQAPAKSAEKAAIKE